jgi:hypothetical protein
MTQNSRYFIERSFRPAGSELLSLDAVSRSLVAARLLVVIIIVGLIIGLVLLGSG